MGFRIGTGLGPFSVSARIGGGGGGGGGDFWIFVCIFGLVASGVPMAFELIRDLITDKAFWIVFILGVIPSIAILLIHASLLSTKSGGRIVFNSFSTMFLALPASGYEIIMLVAADNQSGSAWMLYLSLVPYGFLHWLWIRWTIWVFSSERRALPPSPEKAKRQEARSQRERNKRRAEQAHANAALLAEQDKRRAEAAVKSGEKQATHESKQKLTKIRRGALEDSLTRLSEVTDKVFSQSPESASVLAGGGNNIPESLDKALRDALADVSSCLSACQGILSRDQIGHHQSGLHNLRSELSERFGIQDI